jgi:uncharacterized protein with ATP-grasp and redox domains
MQIFFDCLPCFLRQVLEAARMTTERTDLLENILDETIELISHYREYRYSPEIGREMHRIVEKYTGSEDPYKDVKQRNMEAALGVYPLLKRFLFKKNDRLYWALKTAATGNIIDSAINNNVNIENCIINELEKEFSICDMGEFSRKLKTAKSILFIGDNAGETVFDRVLAEELLYLDTTYAVRSEPVINDATLEDAYASGLDCCERIISSGCNSPGVIIEECSEEFLNIFNSTDIVISKGQGNYETLSENKRGIFFLLKAKCPVIAKKLDININDYVFKYISE